MITVLIMLHLPLLGMQLAHYNSFAKTSVVKNKRAFSTNSIEREKLLEKATPHLWRIYSGYSFKKVIESAPCVAAEQKFTGLQFIGDNQFTFDKKPIKSWSFLGGRKPNIRGELEEVAMVQQTKRDHLNHYTGLISTKDNYLHVVLRQDRHELYQNFSDTNEKSLMQHALQIAKITAKDSVVFLSSDKQYAAVSSTEYRARHPQDIFMASVFCGIIDLKNKNICYSPARGKHRFASAQFSPSNASVFFTAKDTFSERVNHAGFLSLAQKGQCTFNFGNEDFLNKEIDIVGDYSGSKYACIDEIASATISPHGQHILAHILSGDDTGKNEQVILWTIEHMTQKLSEEQLAFIAQLPMADHLYDHKSIEYRTDNAVHVVLPKNTHIPVLKTLLKEHDKAVFLSLPKELQSKIRELYNIEVVS